MINGVTWRGFGDSLMDGVAGCALIPAYSHHGWQPDHILAAIEDVSAAMVSGMGILLSSGLTNNPDGKVHAERQVDALFERGAREIVMLGVGPGVRTGTNEWLAHLVASFPDRMKFTGPLEPPKVGIRMRADQPTPGIHAYDWQDVVDLINAVLAA